MLDTILDELDAGVSELRAALKELDARLAKGYCAFLDKLGHRLYRFGYRLQGEEYEIPDERD